MNKQEKKRFWDFITKLWGSFLLESQIKDRAEIINWITEHDKRIKDEWNRMLKNDVNKLNSNDFLDEHEILKKFKQIINKQKNNLNL